MSDLRKQFDFEVTNGPPRIMRWHGNGCRPASDEECALWDAHSKQQAEVDRLKKLNSDVAEILLLGDRADAIKWADGIAGEMKPGGEVRVEFCHLKEKIEALREALSNCLARSVGLDPFTEQAARKALEETK